MTRMVRGLLVSVAILVGSSAGVVAGEAAVIFPFSGSGTSGNAEPAPLTWLVNNGIDSGGPDQPYWGIPGLEQGIQSWPSAISVTDFHITFEARTVDAEPVPDDPSFDTRLIVEGFDFWTPVINGNTVDFFAPAGTSLDQGERFFVNVALLGGEGIRTFDAHWTTAAVSAPTSLVLLGFGLAGLGAARAWRRR